MKHSTYEHSLYHYRLYVILSTGSMLENLIIHIGHAKVLCILVHCTRYVLPPSTIAGTYLVQQYSSSE